jgi:hypothetical protein
VVVALVVVEFEIVDAFHDRLICDAETLVAVRPVGVLMVLDAVEVEVNARELLVLFVLLVLLLVAVPVTVMVPDMPTSPGAPWNLQWYKKVPGELKV